MKRFGIMTAALAAVVMTAMGQESADTLNLPGYSELDELVIEATKPVLQSNGAKTTYNVDEDPSSGSSTVLDMLKKVPMVSVDGDGNVLLNGSGAFKFQVNGLDNPMLDQYAGQILQAMPAAAVVKIEVITEPGAKEDAEGSAGIINIITERTASQDGYSGSIGLRATNRSLGPSLYGIVKKDKVTLSANANYQWSFLPSGGGQESTMIYTNPEQPGALYSDVSQKFKMQYIGGNIDFSWEPNASNLFTVGANVSYVNSRLSDISARNERFLTDDMQSAPLWSFTQEGWGKMRFLTLSANASFKHTFAEHNYLVLSYLFNFGKTLTWIDRQFTDTYNYFPGYNGEKQDNTSFNRGHTVQADYSNDFGTERHTLDVGAKGIFRRNTGFGSTTLYGIFDEPMLQADATNILQPQDIYAVYASYTGNYGSLGLVAGLRYEHTRMGITNRLDPSQNFTTHLDDVVPNAALTYSLGMASNLRLAYQMRISRPSINQVNPTGINLSPYQVMIGNPNLTSERIHKLSFTYNSFGRVVGGNVTVEYTLANNAISSYYYLEPGVEDAYIVYASYANIGRQQDIGIRGFFNWNVIHNMSLNVNGRVAYNKLSAPAEGSRHSGWSGNIGGAWNYQVADVYKFSAYGGWFSRSIMLQGYRSGFYYYGLSAARDFLADKSLTLSVSATNFLQKRMQFKSFTQTNELMAYNSGFTDSAWNVGISLTWKFGKLNARVKTTGINLDDSDISSSSNSEQSGAGGGGGMM